MEMPKRENRDARKLRSINIIGCKILSSLNVNLMEILTLKIHYLQVKFWIQDIKVINPKIVLLKSRKCVN